MKPKMLLKWIFWSLMLLLALAVGKGCYEKVQQCPPVVPYDSIELNSENF